MSQRDVTIKFINELVIPGIMGRIKTKAIKRTAIGLVDREPEMFKEEFGPNKLILGKEMPSKKVRNMIAGYITRLKRNNKKILAENE